VPSGCESLVDGDVDGGEFGAGHAREGEEVQGAVHDGDVHGDGDGGGVPLGGGLGGLGGGEGEVGGGCYGGGRGGGGHGGWLREGRLCRCGVTTSRAARDCSERVVMNDLEADWERVVLYNGALRVDGEYGYQVQICTRSLLRTAASSAYIYNDASRKK